MAWTKRAEQLVAGDVASIWTLGVQSPYGALYFRSLLCIMCVSCARDYLIVDSHRAIKLRVIVDSV